MPKSVKGYLWFAGSMLVGGAIIRWLGADTWVNDKVDSWKGTKTA